MSSLKRHPFNARKGKGVNCSQDQRFDSKNWTIAASFVCGLSEAPSSNLDLPEDERRKCRFHDHFAGKTGRIGNSKILDLVKMFQRRWSEVAAIVD